MALRPKIFEDVEKVLFNLGHAYNLDRSTRDLISALTENFRLINSEYNKKEIELNVFKEGLFVILDKNDTGEVENRLWDWFRAERKRRENAAEAAKVLEEINKCSAELERLNKVRESLREKHAELIK